MQIEVTATSSDGSSSAQTFNIAISDDNSEFSIGPVSDSDASANSINESANVGDVVGVTALASDADASDTVSYSLSDDAGGAFAIDSVTGEVTVADPSVLDFESSSTMQIEVTATSSDGSSSAQTFNIAISDDNSEFSIGPVSDSDASANSINESANVGDVVGVTALASDADASDTVSYSLSDDAGGAFAIDSVTGEVTVADPSVLDFESSSTMQIEVTATSSDGSSSAQTFNIAISDDNSEFSIGPVSDSDASANSINESANVGDVVGVTALASDADASDTVSYSLSDDAGGAFAIDSVTGEVTVADPSVLDFESSSTMQIEVTATSSDGSSSAQTFNIAISDDNSEFSIGPVSDSDASANSINESANVGDVVGVTALASDADASDTVSYSLSDDAGGAFAIDSVTGEVTVADPSVLDFESSSTMQIEVTATSSDGSSSAQTFNIAISDDNSEFSIGPVSDSDASANSINESANVGDVVGVTALASDADASDTVSYSLSDDAGGAFAIDSVTGEVTVADPSVLDFESSSTMQIEVTATSSDGSSSAQTFNIAISDDNSEFSIGPVSDSDASANSINESANVGDVVGVTALASDADASDTVSYSLSDDAGGAFAIDSVTGEVTVADPSVLDFESSSTMQIEVTATSSDGSSSAQTFNIAISDDNSEFSIGPVSDSDASANSINESANVGDVVGVTALASDADASDTVSYSLSDDAGGAFAIDSVTGEVTVADPSVLDFESSSTMQIEVTATSSDGSSSAQTFNIAISDDNSEFSIGPVSDSDASANSINESANVGDVVGVTALASDADASDTVSYSLSDDAGGAFAIDSVTGEVTVADPSVLDFESSSTMQIEVTATSSDGSSSAQTFNIAISDDNSEFSIGPVSDSDASANSINESANVGDVVGVTALASDADASDTVSYSLSDDAGGAFAIDSVTGEVTVADPSVLDFESSSTMQIEVTATSSDGSSSAQTFNIAISDDNSEFSIGPVSDSDASANSINESANVGDVVGVTALASDADASDTVSYSLSDDAGGAFAIDSVTGEVTVADPSVLDFESSSTMQIEVTATSSDGSSSAQTFNIAISDDNSEFSIGPVSDSDASANSINESANVGDVVGVTALASDADASDTVSYSLSDDAGGAFAIDSVTGEVTVADPSVLDFESSSTMQIEVTATSSDGSSSAQTFNIAISDDNSEFSIGPVSDSDASANSINESANVGDVVGVTALASDADASDTVSYSLSDDAGGAFAIDSVTGEVTVADPSVLDFESSSTMQIEVTATSSDGSSSAQTFNIAISDDNSEFSIGPVSDSDASANSINESANVGDVVGVTALASDADASDTVSYSLSDDAGGAFAIDSVTGEVTVADPSVLDFESSSTMQIEVTATSSDGSSSAQTFNIAISDDNSEFRT